MPKFGFPAQGSGHVQIKCEAGVNIFLDGNFNNQTREDLKGLIIQDIPTGKHVIKAVKEGFQPIEREFNLVSGQVLMIELTGFIPKIETYEEGDEARARITVQTGKIIIQSLPLECSINIPSLDIFGLKKSKDKRIIDKAPAGTYQMEFIALGKTLHYTLQLKGNETVNLMVNFLKDEVIQEGGSVIKAGQTPVAQTGQATPVAGIQTAPQFTPQIITQTPVLAPSNPGSILFSDLFDGTDRTRPANWQIFHAPEREYWYIFDKQFCSGNGDNNPGKNGYSWALVNAAGAEEWTDYEIRTTLWVRQANGKALIIGRYNDDDNFYAAVFEAYQGDRFLKIHKVVDGTWSILASMKNSENGMTIPPMENGYSKKDSQEMVFTLSGSRLRLSLGGNAIVEAQDDTFKQGTCGVGQWYQFVLFDNFTVTAVKAGAPTQSAPPGMGQAPASPKPSQWSPLPQPKSY
ncbi:hypothetical protein JW926_11900 [Candidatus Sumerlaeota bacterium]|nr:hypothetical protein [Candidatus Sumerlaeota bacterium]